MGNCLWTSIDRQAEHGNVWKIMNGGRLCMKGSHIFHTPRSPCQPATPLKVNHRRGRHHLDDMNLTKVDVSKGLDLHLENSTAPCRLSSGTASDLIARMSTSSSTSTSTCKSTATFQVKPSLEVLPSTQKGIWKVKLVITAEQLAEILSHDSNTEALIERMSMTAAKDHAHKQMLKNSPDQHQHIGCLSKNTYCPWRPSVDNSTWRPSLDSISEYPFGIPQSPVVSCGSEFLEIDMSHENTPQRPFDTVEKKLLT